ncbi:glycoprotein-N-acetylgalactosamine 3-beta-galactosyltransferase 1 [Drosophila biarmipes]|uniref:glycoprotein-N-acetylgalactosamine 3-beta-galactosyltransferase 1 n=1 Tax=Drosophila biarmipes TaxID=125945 RepID=UPI0007E61373|nr:glycoprotein-N-acetylgalactosamine 3-beta-galactosyltransferase 1 [Drosophila biarmipes]XP_050741293.1 glycoprotein-N-acetylgalactosamine 3-beta-galactosyltransferase 1 [Drosophila biarmipes]
MGVRPHCKRMELILMVLIGMAWGVLLSALMKRDHWQYRGDPLRGESSPFPSSHRSMPSPNTTTIHPLPDIPSARLFNETRVLCLVMTSPKNHQSRAIHIQGTWGTRCNKLIFMSTKADEQLGTVVLNVREGYSNSWPKTRASLEYVYKRYFHQYDWFLKADDDTYVIMENLRALLYAQSPKRPILFGDKFQTHVKEGYTSGGSSYVLSRMALHRLIKLGFSNSSICTNRNYGYEDVELGRCLSAVGVATGDSRDENGLSRFIPISPLHWYSQALLNNATPDNTNDCCSNTAISFHFNNALEFYMLDYVLYKLRIFGINNVQDILRSKNSIWSTFQTTKTELGKNSINKIGPENNDTKRKSETKPKTES